MHRNLSCSNARLILTALSMFACGSPPEPLPPPLDSPAVAAPPAAPERPPTSAAGTPYVWKNVVILGGGFVSGVVFSPARAGLAYARTDVGGAYRMNADKSSWTPLTDHFGRSDS